MTIRNVAIGTLFGLMAISGSAFAAGSVPAAGENPVFDNAAEMSAASRAEVMADAVRHPAAAGEQSSVAAAPAAASPRSRAEVRAETRDALANGFHIAAGQQS